MLEVAENGESHGRIDCLGLARITTPLMERQRGSWFQCGAWEAGRIQGLEFMAHPTADVPYYCCCVYSHCAKCLTYTTKIWK